MVSLFDRTTIFRWCVVTCGSKNVHQRDVCFNKIILRAQFISILGSIINIIEGGRDLYNHFISLRIFTLIMNKIFI